MPGLPLAALVGAGVRGPWLLSRRTSSLEQNTYYVFAHDAHHLNLPTVPRDGHHPIIRSLQHASEVQSCSSAWCTDQGIEAQQTLISIDQARLPQLMSLPQAWLLPIPINR